MNQLPKVLLNEGQREFTENFRSESFDGKRWRPRVAQSNKDNNRPILVGKTRQLINSVRTSGRSATNVRLLWGSYLKYAAVHNFGLTVYKRAHKRTATRTVKIRGSGGFVNGKFTKGRAKKMTISGVRHNVSATSFKMPRRQFMGVTIALRKRLLNKASKLMRL